MKPLEWLARLLSESLLGHLQQQGQQIRAIHMGIEEIRASQARTEAALSNIADDVRRLAAAVTTGLTVEQVQEIQDRAERIALRAEGVAAETPEPTA